MPKRRTKVISKVDNLASVYLRLLPEVDEAMRDHVRRRGDVAAFVTATAAGVDLCQIPLLEMSFHKEGPCETLCNIAANLDQKVRATAEKRGCSINRMWNSAIAAYVSSLPREQE
jgi:hypothetical protein